MLPHRFELHVPRWAFGCLRNHLIASPVSSSSFMIRGEIYNFGRQDRMRHKEALAEYQRPQAQDIPVVDRPY
jgi:hypothetical protein